MRKFRIIFNNNISLKKFNSKSNINKIKRLSRQKKIKKGYSVNRKVHKNFKNDKLNSKFLIRLNQDVSDKFFFKKYSFDKNKVFLIVRFLVYYKLYFFFEKFF